MGFFMAIQNWYKHPSNSSMDVPKIRFCLPVGAQPYIDFTNAAEREPGKKAEARGNIKKWAANLPLAKLL